MATGGRCRTSTLHPLHGGDHGAKSKCGVDGLGIDGAHRHDRLRNQRGQRCGALNARGHYEPPGFIERGSVADPDRLNVAGLHRG